MLRSLKGFGGDEGGRGELRSSVIKPAKTTTNAAIELFNYVAV